MKDLEAVLYLVLAIGMLVGLLALNVLGAKRLLGIARDLLKGELRPRNHLAGLLGGLVWLLLAVGLLGVIGVVIATFFFMNAGSASGIPLAMALVGFPIACLLGEWLFSACFAYRRNDEPVGAGTAG